MQGDSIIVAIKKADADGRVQASVKFRMVEDADEDHLLGHCLSTALSGVEEVTADLLGCIATAVWSLGDAGRFDHLKDSVAARAFIKAAFALCWGDAPPPAADASS